MITMWLVSYASILDSSIPSDTEADRQTDTIDQKVSQTLAPIQCQDPTCPLTSDSAGHLNRHQARQRWYPDTVRDVRKQDRQNSQNTGGLP
jgi:hypothetical protein